MDKQKVQRRFTKVASNHNSNGIMSDRSKLYESLLPLLYASKLVALGSIEYHRKRDKLQISRISMTYNIIKGAMFFGCFLYMAKGVKIVSMASDTLISDVAGWFDLYAGATSQTIAIFLTCFNSKKIIHFYDTLTALDKKLFIMGEKINYKTTLKFVSVGVALVFLEFVVTFVTDYVLFIKDQSKMQLVTTIVSYYPIITTGIVKLQLNTFVFLLLQRFWSLNNILKKMEYNIVRRPVNTNYVPIFLKNIRGDPYSHTVNIAHGIYTELCELGRLINYLYGFQFLITVGTGFTICVSQLYYVYTQIKEQDEDNMVVDAYFSAQWAVLQILEIQITLYICERTHKEISKTISYVHSLHHADSNKELKSSVRQFSLHVMHQNVKFTACGFFGLNYTLSQTMISAICSYLIIMIQYDLAKNSIED